MRQRFLIGYDCSLIMPSACVAISTSPALFVQAHMHTPVQCASGACTAFLMPDWSFLGDNASSMWL